MKQTVLNLFFMVLAFTVQNCIFPLVPYLSSAPNLLLILVFTFGFIYGKGTGMLYGLVAGILMDLFGGGPFGFYMLIYIYMGYINGICTKYYYEDYITLPLALCVINELAYNLYIYIFRFVLRNRLDFLYYAREIIIPEVIFTVVVTLFFYRSFLFASRKLEELDKRKEHGPKPARVK